MKKIFTLLCMTLCFGFIASCSNAAHHETSKNKITVPPVSIQLWSVKDKIEKDFKGTLKTLSDLGFNGVEFAGNYGPYTDDPQGLKSFLDSLSLKASGAHLGIKTLTNKDADKQLSFLKSLGVEYVIIPMDSRAWDANKVDDLINDINTLESKLAKMGLKIGYHNHDQEFNAHNKSTFWDYIAQNTSQNVILQMDVGWVNYAGKNPIHYLKQYPNRTLTTHIKVRTKKGSEQSPIIGEDGYDWANHIKHNVKVGGTQWLVLEQEEYPYGLDSMQSVAMSKQGLDQVIDKL